jgi:hypothetical protein
MANANWFEGSGPAPTPLTDNDAVLRTQPQFDFEDNARDFNARQLVPPAPGGPVYCQGFPDGGSPGAGGAAGGPA